MCSACVCSSRWWQVRLGRRAISRSVTSPCCCLAMLILTITALLLAVTSWEGSSRYRQRRCSASFSGERWCLHAWCIGATATIGTCSSRANVCKLWPLSLLSSARSSCSLWAPLLCSRCMLSTTMRVTPYASTNCRARCRSCTVEGLVLSSIHILALASILMVAVRRLR